MRRLIALMLAVSFAAVPVARGEDSSLVQESLFQEVSLRDLEQNGSRFYLAGIVGSSFATLSSPDLPSASGPLFTSGGAAGVAFAAWDRAWRLEFEGRARDPITETQTFDGGSSTSTLSATGGWSATVNLWRDYDLTERLTCYVGGGIGGGGYSSLAAHAAVPAENFTIDGSGSGSGFAWQAGGGVAYAITDRITLDLGYRFFAVNTGGITATSRQDGVPIETLSIDSEFSASELFFAIRVYEPFRGWR